MNVVSESAVTLKTFFERARAGHLTGIRCGKCSEIAIPPKEFCSGCGTRDWTPVELSGDGVIDTFTVIRVAPRAFAADAPYAIAHVRLAEGPGMLGRVVDLPLDRVAVGLRVKFRPLIANDQTSVGFAPA